MAMVTQLQKLYALLHHSMPDTTEKAIWVLLTYILADTLCGAWVGFACREVASRRFIEGLMSKSVQFGGILISSGGASFLTGSWVPFTGAICALSLNEQVSIIENVRRLQNCGGIKLPAALNEMLDKWSGFLSVSKKG